MQDSRSQLRLIDRDEPISCPRTNSDGLGSTRLEKMIARHNMKVTRPLGKWWSCLVLDVLTSWENWTRTSKPSILDHEPKAISPSLEGDLLFPREWLLPWQTQVQTPNQLWGYELWSPGCVSFLAHSLDTRQKQRQQWLLLIDPTSIRYRETSPFKRRSMRHEGWGLESKLTRSEVFLE